MAFESGDVSSDFILAVWGLMGDIRAVQKKSAAVEAAPLLMLQTVYCTTSITPSALMLTWLVPASTSGVGAESIMAAFIIIPPRA
jgi:hypothetical protein